MFRFLAQKFKSFPWTIIQIFRKCYNLFFNFLELYKVCIGAQIQVTKSGIRNPHLAKVDLKQVELNRTSNRPLSKNLAKIDHTDRTTMWCQIDQIWPKSNDQILVFWVMDSIDSKVAKSTNFEMNTFMKAKYPLIVCLRASNSKESFALPGTKRKIAKCRPDKWKLLICFSRQKWAHLDNFKSYEPSEASCNIKKLWKTERCITIRTFQIY